MKQMILFKNLLILSWIIIRKKNLYWEMEVILYLRVLVYCLIISIKQGLKRKNSYIKSHEWVSSKKAIINPKYEDDKCFKYSIAVALNHKEFKSHPEKLSNIRHFFSYDCNWKGIKYPAGIKDWKSFEKIMKQLLLIFCKYHMMK